MLFEHQDRTLWDRRQIEEGKALVARAFVTGEVGPYAIQAAIAAEHAASHGSGIDWKRVVSLYDLLLLAQPSPVAELNRAAAIAMRDGPDEGIRLIDAILHRGDLVDYYPAHSAKGELLSRAGRKAEAVEAFRRALKLAKQDQARAHLEGRLAGLSS